MEVVYVIATKIVLPRWNATQNKIVAENLLKPYVKSLKTSKNNGIYWIYNMSITSNIHYLWMTCFRFVDGLSYEAFEKEFFSFCPFNVPFCDKYLCVNHRVRAKQKNVNEVNPCTKP